LAYVFAEWRLARVHIDYHIAVDEHYYSVPYTQGEFALHGFLNRTN
jgi:hypothetical protein